MDNREILNNLKKIIPKEKIKQKEPMKNHTSLKIGGPADFFIEVNSEEMLKNVLQFSKKNKIPLTVVGNGSNLLVLDKGIKGIVIKVEFKQIQIAVKDEETVEIKVENGVQLGYLAQKLLKEEISGFEELSGIPGTIGGAVVMNAGAHGKEMKDIVTEVKAMDYKGNIHTFTNEQSEFKYRHSKFSKGEYIVLQVKMKLKKGKKETIKNKMNEYAQYRKEKQPIQYPSAGSTFKRGIDYMTAKLIDDAGLKGYSIGGAKISEKHAGFIINTGSATAQDVLNLIEYVENKIFEIFKKKIEIEIKIIGEK